ncbi:MAG: hypothetical protein Q8P24_20180 [Desulfobacterales bacterium]|nr:hypothetical protein [Desulfobacterales bacterium]
MESGRSVSHKKLDLFFLLLIILIVAAVPVGIRQYEKGRWPEGLSSNAKKFTLTGHSGRGWILGEVKAYETLRPAKLMDPADRPVIAVSKGDLVVLKLKSSDVIHGFSLKDAGIYLTEGIHPGRAVFVTFRADKAGIFTFSCNAICGVQHQKMQGTLIVKV